MDSPEYIEMLFTVLEDHIFEVEQLVINRKKYQLIDYIEIIKMAVKAIRREINE